MFKVIRELRRQRRWKGRNTGRSELGSLLRRGVRIDPYKKRVKYIRRF